MSLNRKDQERVSRLHREKNSPGMYRVGASPLTIRRYVDEKGNISWDIYGDTLAGPCRIPGQWSFPRLAQARARAFEYAGEQGWT
jgi:hypothetical protein